MAVARLAKIFSVPTDSIDPAWRFGHELNASFVSDFRQNELDCVNDDIWGVADRTVARLLRKQILIIHSVRDYYDLMVARSRKDPKLVLDILGMH